VIDLLAIGTGSIVLIGVTEVLRPAFTSRHLMIFGAAFDMVGLLAFAIAATVVLALGGSPYELLAASVAGNAVTLVCAVALLRRTNLRPRLATAYRRVLPVLRAAVPLAGVTLASTVYDRLDVIMLPKVDGPWDINYLDQLLAQLEARHQLKKPILIHAILETAQGVNNVEAIASASPRMHGMSLGPADLAASRAMKTTRVGGGHPDYKVLADAQGDAPRASSQQDLWHYTIAKMVDACAAAGIKPFYGPFGDFGDPAGCEAQFRNAFLMGCVGAWSLHPSQIDIAKKVFSPDPGEVAFAQKIVAAMPDGAGAVMIDGKMQDDATWKQAKVLLDLAKLVAAKDPDAKRRYAL